MGKVIHEFDAKGISVSEERLEKRLRVLIKLKQIEPAGNVSRWRFSEIRIPVSGEPSKQPGLSAAKSGS